MYDLYWLQAQIWIITSYYQDHIDFQNSFPMAKYFKWIELRIFTSNVSVCDRQTTTKYLKVGGINKSNVFL